MLVTGDRGNTVHILTLNTISGRHNLILSRAILSNYPSSAGHIRKTILLSYFMIVSTDKVL
jgi:hypothetical protein